MVGKTMGKAKIRLVGGEDAGNWRNLGFCKSRFEEIGVFDSVVKIWNWLRENIEKMTGKKNLTKIWEEKAGRRGNLGFYKSRFKNFGVFRIRRKCCSILVSKERGEGAEQFSRLGFWFQRLDWLGSGLNKLQKPQRERERRGGGEEEVREEDGKKWV